jgi:hypothetical protein
MTEQQTRTERQAETGFAGESQTCPNCQMSREEWQGNAGQGYEYQGQTYCCQGCGEGTGCTCR